MNTQNLAADDKVFVRADLYDAGITEDGSPYTAEVYSIVVESRDGFRRVLTSKSWFTAPGDTSPDGFMFFGDLRKEMKAEAEAVVKRIQDKGIIDLDYWMEIQPRYGSDYYIHKNVNSSF